MKMAHSIPLGLLAGGALGAIVVSAVPSPWRQADKPVHVALAPPKPAEPAGYVVKRALKIDEPIVHGLWKWDESGVPAGPGRIVITVDTKAQTMSVFRDGYEIGATAVLTGLQL